MAQSLVIVESPAKAKTIKKYLGRSFRVLASIGHVKDLPTKELGVDVEKNFTPTYVTVRGKSKTLKQITDAAMTAADVYLAPDPDREGEAIAWHIAEEIQQAAKQKKKKSPAIHRALFHEITSGAVKRAIETPGTLNSHLYEAQQARRILDRLVGYQISPLLWEKVRRGLSAGRVQSVVVRMVCEREAEVAAFTAEEYWSVLAKLEGSKAPAFEAKLISINEEKISIGNEGVAKKVVTALHREKFLLQTITQKERKRHPTPPFTTSKLQQEAARKLGFTAKKTMALAQMLYEGIELGGDDGHVGLITYMRTDSVRVAPSALDEVRAYIRDRFSKESLPAEPNFYKGKKGAQDAHEAIRPTSVQYPPEAVASYLERDLLRLYDLIWKRFVASQMTPAVFDQTAFDIAAGKHLLRATGQVLRFPGFIAVYMEDVDDAAEKDEEENPTLPNLSEGETLKLLELTPHQHFTQAPPRYTEASLVKALEELGIGRPSTYASIMGTIQEKDYVKKQENRFFPSELGKLVNELLVASFPNILDVGFTARMEEELDEVEEGRRTWVSALEDFYGPFEKTLASAKKKMRDVKREVVATSYRCEKCGSSMVIKWGRHGEFLACSAYPECRTTKEFRRSDSGAIEIVEKKTTDAVCDQCGSPMVVKRGRFGEFLACSRYPDCKATRSIGTGVACPNGDGGELVQRRTKRGRYFYGCNKYPQCTYAVWDKPVPGPCPQCGHPILVEKYSKKTQTTSLACPQKECSYRRENEEASGE